MNSADNFSRAEMPSRKLEQGAVNHDYSEVYLPVRFAMYTK